VPPAPNFAIAVSPGAIELSGIAFSDLRNTAGIVAGTYTFHYYDEIGGVPVGLSAAVGATDPAIRFATTVASGKLVQIEQEIVLAEATDTGGNTTVTRAMHNTTAAAHLVTVPAYPLSDVNNVVIVPFIRNFFGTPASGKWNYSLEFPDIRIASVELYMTNALGDGAVTIIPFTGTSDSGLRTLAGGQYSFQITGYLAVQAGATPNIVVDATRSVRDIYAVLRGAPSGAGVTLQLNRMPPGGTAQPWATVQFDPDTTTSYSVAGFGLPSLNGGDQLSLDVTGVGTLNPGSDLTVVVRL
jgi:hypothetical protein